MVMVCTVLWAFEVMLLLFVDEQPQAVTRWSLLGA